MVHLVYYFIEFLDELVFGVREAAWPLIRNDLHLSYIQIGVALSLPGILANLIEPFAFVLGDVWKRRTVILSGGAVFAAAVLLTGMSGSFAFFMAAMILLNPASGAFVGLAQANLMDDAPARREHNMARWTFAGSIAVVLGPLALAGAVWIGFGWRDMFLALAPVATIALLAAAALLPGNVPRAASVPVWAEFIGGLRELVPVLRDASVIRWLVLLEFSDLGLDVFYGFLPLYFVDAAGFTPVQAAMAIIAWSGVGLLGDLLLIPLLERVRGLDYLRVSVIVELVLFPLFLLCPIAWLKLVIVGAMGFFNAGWYAILKAKLFESMHGKSGAAQALDNVSGMIGKLIPLGIGFAAQSFGIAAAMWLLLAGPIALVIGLPRAQRASSE